MTRVGFALDIGRKSNCKGQDWAFAWPGPEATIQKLTKSYARQLTKIISRDNI